MNKLGFTLKQSKNKGIFHDSRKDANQLAFVCNRLIEKVDELVDTVNQLQEEIYRLKS